jgi:hypothetical protein
MATAVTQIGWSLTLDGFTDRVAETEGLDLRDLGPMTTLVVCTCNTRYRIIVSQGTAVFVEGGQFFPEPTAAFVEGASLGGSFLKLGWIGVGLRMEIHAGGQRIVTSPVRTIVAERPPTPSVH